MRTIKVVLIGSILSTLFLAAGCKNQTGNQGATGTNSVGGKTKKLAFVTNNASDFWTIARKGTEKASAEFKDISVEFRIPGEGTAADQKRVLDDLVAAGIDGERVS